MARALLIFLAALLLAASPAHADPRANLADFDAMWRAIDEGYARFDGASRAAWRAARKKWRARAGAAKTRGELVLALEGALAHLCDDRVALSEREARSARLVPAETDAWVEWRGGKAVVTAVRVSSEADVAGLQPGHVVTHIEGVAIERAVREKLRELGASGEDARNCVLRRFLAGPRTGLVHVRVAEPGGGSRVLEIGRVAANPANGPPIVARRMGEDRDIGYVRIKNVLGDARLPAQVDGVLGHLADARALIIDLRETEGGGVREVAEAVAARIESAAQRAKVVVLVDRWTGGEGETLAAALARAAHATLIGTPTAGLRGELREVGLPHSGIGVRFPATPREPVRPTHEVDLAAPSGGPGDPILYQALKLLAPSPARDGRSAPR